MKEINFNMNDFIRVKLTEKGWHHLANKYAKYFPHHLYPAYAINHKGNALPGSKEFIDWLY
ncbi:MAG TPA: hypothetical protein PLJ00_14970, partial [Chitinophagales bacterium]|nr:hypothetical protein [Chitinophagales bacterium]